MATSIFTSANKFGQFCKYNNRQKKVLFSKLQINDKRQLHSCQKSVLENSLKCLSGRQRGQTSIVQTRKISSQDLWANYDEAKSWLGDGFLILSYFKEIRTNLYFAEKVTFRYKTKK